MVVGMLALAASAVQADKLYKWVDKQGRVTYHDTPPTSDEYRVEEKDVRLRGSRETPVDRPPVLLYSAPDCQSCDLAREYLKKRQVPFTEKNASGDVKVQEELKKKVGTLSVPVLLVGEKVMKGYLESLLAGELDQAGYPKIAELQSGAAAPEKRERESLAPAP
jgi:glutaredoxin